MTRSVDLHNPASGASCLCVNAFFRVPRTRGVEHRAVSLGARCLQTPQVQLLMVYNPKPGDKAFVHFEAA